MTNEQKTLCQRCCIELEPWEQSLCFACASRECELTYVVRVSGGAGSTVAAHRCVEKHGAKNTVLLFADTNSEDESLYASMRYMRDHALKDVEMVWLKNDGQNIWDIFEKHRCIKTLTGCKASYELKKRPLDEYVRSRWPDLARTVAVTGLDFTEEDRVQRFDAVFHARGQKTWHPLTERPFLNSCQQVEMVESWGYPKQLMYEKGYPHNNCSGGCVLAGISQWVGLYRDFPERFRYHAQREAAFFARTGYSILRDRRGGTSKPMTLLDLEQRILSDDLKGLSEFRSTCGCMTPAVVTDSEGGELREDDEEKAKRKKRKGRKKMKK